MKKQFFQLAGILFLFFALALSSARAATWYLHADQTTDWNTLNIWWSQPISGGINPTSILATDDFDLSAHQLYTPNVSGTNTFGGSHLILHGGRGGFLSVKTLVPNTVVVGNLTSYGGFFGNAASTGNVPMSITNFINSGYTTISGGIVNRGLDLTIGTLTGNGDICAVGRGGGAAGGAILMSVTTASAFTGTLYIDNGCQFTFKNAVNSGGALDVSGTATGTAVTLNATVTFKGFTLNGVAMANGTYTAASLGFNGSGSVVVQSPVASNPPISALFGTNLPGGSFGGTAFYPTDALVWDYLRAKNLNLVRVAFKWERVQPTLLGALDSAAIAKLDTVCSLAAARGQKVLLDMHNYDTYNGVHIGTAPVTFAAFQDVWQKLAAHFAGNSAIYGYDIMNEPAGAGGVWISTSAQYGVNGVRQSDTTHYVIVEGESYSGALSWMNVNQNLNVTDSANKLIYSAHTYWDNDNSGTYTSSSYDTNNAYPNIGVDRVGPFIYWLQLKGYKGLIGEFGVPNNVASPDARWNVALQRFLRNLNANGVDGTYWSMTQNGWPDTYSLLCAKGGKAPGPVVDAPAMSVLQAYGAPPVITSGTTAVATVGTSFSYQITATNNPTSYNATPLPSGLSVDTATGVISGIPMTDGISTVTLSGSNTGGTGTATLTLTVSPPPTLSNLVLSTGALTPAFTSAITSYTASVPNTSTSLTVTPTVTDINATIKVNDATVTSASASAPISLLVGSNIITTVVTAQDSTTTKSYSVTVTRQTALESWRLSYFGTTSNTGNAADSADPEHDGLSNLLEFATNSNPASPSFPPGVAARNGSNIEFTYTRAKAAMSDGFTFIVEWSATLAAASWSNSGVSETIVSENASVQNIKATLPTGIGTHRFVHLKVTAP